MARSKRWTGEWLVKVDDQGRVMLPRMTQSLQPDGPQPTHYKIVVGGYGQAEGTLQLVPMREATEEDLRPVDPEPEPEPQTPEPESQNIPTRQYYERERKSLEFECPYCGVEPGEGCIARPSGRRLDAYPEALNWTHKRRQDLVPVIRIVKETGSDPS